MRRLLSLLLCAVLLVGLSSCRNTSTSESNSSSSDTSREEPSVSTPFTLPVFSEFSLHPALGASRANLTLAPLLYESLFLVDEHYQAVPILCESFSSTPDHLTWTFTIRSGITFSDGTPLSGQVVADALELARSPQGRFSTRLADISSISSEDNTVTVSLTRPNGSLPLLLDIPISLGSSDRPAGTGPYQLTADGDSLFLSTRAGWWQSKSLPLNRIPLHGVSKSEDLIYAFDTGNISLLDVDLMATNALGYGGNYQAWDYTTTDLLYLGFNTSSGPCRTPEVRRALASAVERTVIVQNTYASHAVAASLPVHPDSSLYDMDIANKLAYQPDILANQLSSLHLNGKTLTFLVNSENSAKTAAAQLIAYQLESTGLSIRLEQLPFEDFTAALSRGDFDLYLGETVLTADFDLTPLLSSAGPLNYGGWQNASADELLSAMRDASGDEKVLAAKNLFTLLDQQVPIAPILFKNGSALTQWGRLAGLTPLRGNMFYQLENWIIS